MANYIFELLPALERVAPEIEPVLFLRDDRWFRRDLIRDLVPGAERRWIIEPLKMPLRGLDRFHGMGTRLPASKRVPRSFTLHDLRGIDPVPGLASTGNAERKKRTVNRADRILVLTAHGARRLRHHFPHLDESRISVVGHGVDLERFRPAGADEVKRVRDRHGLPERFLLQLGSFFPHKNLELSIDAFARCRAQSSGVILVLAGGGGDPGHRKSLEQRVVERGLFEKVRWIDHVASQDLAPLVSAAQLLLMPSRYEGFGLPILEAMASGTAGVSSTAACLPEVCASIWEAHAPDDVESWAHAIDRLALDPDARRSTEERGLAHARTKTWDECARQTAAFLHLT